MRPSAPALGVHVSSGGRYTAKVYVVQKADRQGNLHGPVLAVKLTHADAHAVARAFAPARVTCVMADKTPDPNGPDSIPHHPPCK
ncbi:MAG: hypothetical protein LC676_06570 [Loktanella sp.]|nr:hypothetical protein [Loktanella sp.]